MNKHLNLLLKTVFVFFIIIVPFITQASNPLNLNGHRHQNNRGNLTLEQAAAKGDLETAQLLINNSHMNLINQRRGNDNGQTALMSAAGAGHFTIAEALIAAGADVNLPSLINNETPLIVAARGCHTDIVELLLAAQAETDNRAYNNGQTALIAATLSNCTDAVEALVEARADLDIQQRIFLLPALRGICNCVNTRTALIIAVGNENAEIVRILTDAGANLDLIDYSNGDIGETAFTTAYYNGNTTIMNILRVAEARNFGLSLSPAQIFNPVPPQGFHGIVSNLLESGMTVEQVSDITGFSNEVIRRYSRYYRPHPHIVPLPL